MGIPHYGVECADHHDIVRDFDGPRPPITVLCGSTRFGDAYREHNLQLTIAGHIVLSIGCDLRDDHELWGHLSEADLEALKDRLDVLHKRKIDLADEVLVLNVSGYIGDSTRSEIEYAEKLGKPIRYLEPLSLCRLRLPASAIGSICGRPMNHDGHCGAPIADTPLTPGRSR